MRQVLIPPHSLPGGLNVPEASRGLILFAHGSGSSRLSGRNRAVARVLNEAGLATLLFDLLTEEEDRDWRNRFDIPLLAERLSQATDWAKGEENLRHLPVGYFGASTGAAAALTASTRQRGIFAVVSRGGRPDLAGAALAQVSAPTLLIVGGRDEEVLDLNGQAQQQLRADSSLRVVEGATHLFEEPGTLDQVAALARDWFLDHLDAGDYSNAKLRDRREAGRKLAARLRQYRRRADCLVMGLPRGGVVVAAALANELQLPFDACVVRKLGVPYQPELAMGAVAADGVTVVHRDAVQICGVSEQELRAEIDSERKEVARREQLYRGGRPFPDVTAKTVILADDGIATGATVEAAIQVLRHKGAKRIVVAAGVAAAQTVRRLRRSADEVVTVLTPDDLRAISLWFEEFEQVEDDEVIDLMAARAV